MKNKYNDNYIRYLEQLALLDQVFNQNCITVREKEIIEQFLIYRYKVQN